MSVASTRCSALVTPASTAGAATSVAYREVDRQRRPLQGCTAPSFSGVLSDPAPWLKMLRSSGIGVVEGVLDERMLSQIRATAVYESMPASMQRARHRLSRARQQVSSKFYLISSHSNP